MKSFILTSFLTILAYASPVIKRGTGAPYTLQAFDISTNRIFDDVTACQGLFYLGGPKCGSPNLDVPTVVNIFPSNIKAILDSTIGYQQVYVHKKTGQVIFAVFPPKGEFDGELAEGWVLKDGEVSVQGKKWYGCVGVSGDRKYRLFVDLNGDMEGKPGCREFKIVATVWQGQPPTEKYWYSPV